MASHLPRTLTDCVKKAPIWEPFLHSRFSVHPVAHTPNERLITGLRLIVRQKEQDNRRSSIESIFLENKQGQF